MTLTELSTTNIIIAVDEAQGLMTVTWKKNTGSEEYRKAYGNIAELYRQHRCQTWMIDQRQKDGATLAAEVEWMTKTWLPALIRSGAAGIKVGIVLSMNAFAEFSTRRLSQQVKDDPTNNLLAETKFHKTKEECLEWLVG
jgi:hypothetical protein